ncbi:aminotransferase-like domain-containing protein, partial [Albidovulum sp.]
RGTFVASSRPKRGAAPPPVTAAPPPRAAGHAAPPTDLRVPQLPDLGQARAIAAALASLGEAECRDYLGYGGLTRDQGLRARLVDWLGDRVLGPVGADDLALTHGGQSGINLALQCCLKGARPQVFCEELSYPGFRHAARLNRAEIVPIALDDEGMRPDALAAACRRHDARTLFVTTEAQNPTTVRMPLERRRRIVEIARRFDIQIIEDDCYSVQTASEPALRALAPERTWHVTSISKSLAAGLRFGMVVCPAGLGETGRLAAQHGYLGLSRPIVDLLERLLETGQAAALRARVQALFARRLEMTLNALGGFALGWQQGLAFVWLRMPQGWRASTFMREAEAAGVLLRSADEFALVESHSPNAVRIALNGAVAEAEFAAALGRLAHLLRNPPGDLAV